MELDHTYHCPGKKHVCSGRAFSDGVLGGHFTDEVVLARKQAAVVY